MSTTPSFRMIGADGREYGPIPADQMRSWIKEGRADRFTQVQPAGETWWKPLGQFAEFADLLPPPPTLPSSAPSTGPDLAGSPPPSAPPPLAPFTPSSAYSGSSLGLGQGQPKTDGMAIAGAICSGIGLIPCCCCGTIFSGLGLAFSLIGLNSINADPVNRTGKGLAIAGIVMGAVGLLFFVITLIFRPWEAPAFHELLRQLKHM